MEPTEILQIKLWLMITFQRETMEQNPLIHPDYDYIDRPLFEEITFAFHTYMKTSNHPYSIYNAYMFYDFFCSQRNFSPDSSFAYRLAESHRKEKSYLCYMNKVILKHLKQQGYLLHYASTNQLLYIENLLFQLHAQLYYFHGFILPFDHWTMDSLLTMRQHPSPLIDASELLSVVSKKLDIDSMKNDAGNKFAELYYTIILNHISELNVEKISIGVHHSLNPFIAELVIQHLRNYFGLKYPIKAEIYTPGQQYDIFLSNILTETLKEECNFIYIFSDASNNYDMLEIEKMIIQLVDIRQVSDVIV